MKGGCTVEGGFGQEGLGYDRNVGKRRCGQSGRGGVAGAIPQRQRVQRTGPWSAFRREGEGEALFCTVKDVLRSL